MPRKQQEERASAEQTKDGPTPEKITQWVFKSDDESSDENVEQISKAESKDSDFKPTTWNRKQKELKPYDEDQVPITAVPGTHSFNVAVSRARKSKEENRRKDAMRKRMERSKKKARNVILSETIKHQRKTVFERLDRDAIDTLEHMAGASLSGSGTCHDFLTRKKYELTTERLNDCKKMKQNPAVIADCLPTEFFANEYQVKDGEDVESTSDEDEEEPTALTVDKELKELAKILNAGSDVSSDATSDDDELFDVPYHVLGYSARLTGAPPNPDEPAAKDIITFPQDEESRKVNEKRATKIIDKTMRRKKKEFKIRRKHKEEVKRLNNL